jgi:diguanylate cyclase (GGDEF)-like protein/PAS domain S-box-containing protein
VREKLLEPAIPFDEVERLATLRGLNIMDTPPEERFDRLTRLAQHLFTVPIALVSLIDSNRQWFKSCQGLNVNETPRNISFCGHAILNDQTLIIADASLDPRFADNPLVTGAPNIRFYAGQPLSAADGRKMGTLCIIDIKPHHFSQIERNSLRDLATWVEKELNSLEFSQLATALLDSQNRLAGILDNVLDGIITIDDKGIIDSFNKSATKIFGYTPEEVIGNNVSMLMPQPYKFEHDGYLHNYLTTHQPKVIGIGRKLLGCRKSGRTFPMHLAVTKVENPQGVQFIGLVRDISQEEADRQQIEYLALHDALTSLPNRTFFTQQIASNISAGKPFALLFIDIDGFKPINDNFGHKVGDQVLIAIAQRLQGTVAVQDFVSRLGGDEFVVILNGIETTNDVIQVGERILAKIGSPLNCSGNDCNVGASIGATLCLTLGKTEDEILNAADKAMYKAKLAGKNRMVMAD